MEETAFIVSSLIVLSLVGVIWKMFRRSLDAKAQSAPQDAAMPSTVGVEYSSRETLMTQAEVQAFRLLYRKLRGVGYLCPKVRISDLISVRTPDAPKQRLRELSRLSQKHVDFAVISLKGDILCAIEVDDASHGRAKTIQRDQFVNSIFKAAGIPLFRGNVAELNGDENFASFVEQRLIRQNGKTAA